MLKMIPGIGEDSAMVIIGIIGNDMSRFETTVKICAWAGLAPGNNESAGQKKSSRTTKGHALLRKTMVVCVQSAAHTKHTFLGSRFGRLVPHLGAKKAVVAVAHSMLQAIWRKLSTGELYHDLGVDFYASLDRERRIKASINKMKKLGLDTTTVEAQLETLRDAQAETSSADLRLIGEEGDRGP